MKTAAMTVFLGVSFARWIVQLIGSIRRQDYFQPGFVSSEGPSPPCSRLRQSPTCNQKWKAVRHSSPIWNLQCTIGNGKGCPPNVTAPTGAHASGIEPRRRGTAVHSNEPRDPALLHGRQNNRTARLRTWTSLSNR
jgi:hypothetical protein